MTLSKEIEKNLKKYLKKEGYEESYIPIMTELNPLIKKAIKKAIKQAKKEVFDDFRCVWTRFMDDLAFILQRKINRRTGKRVKELYENLKQKHKVR